MLKLRSPASYSLRLVWWGRKFNGLLSGLDPPARTAPEPPSLLASNRSGIAWRGTVGAQTYVLQRRKGGDDQAAEGDGEWWVGGDACTPIGLGSR